MRLLVHHPGGVFARDELPERDRDAARRVLVVKCAMTKCIFAHAVPQKGVDPDGFVIDRLREDIVWLGHASVVIRRDNEPALARVVEKSIKVLKQAEGVTASWEGSVPYDAQTNGAAENAVRLVKGMFKVLLLGLEREIEARIPLDHPIVPWLFRHGAYLRALQIKGEDGMTAHQRARRAVGPSNC